MEKIYDLYQNYIKDGGALLEEIDFEEFMKVRMIELRKNGFDVEYNEESINKALKENEEIWYSKKINKITFMPGSLNDNYNLEIDELIRYGNIKDNKSSNWNILYARIEDDVMEIKTLISSINIDNIIDKFDRLKVKEGYTLQIYKLQYKDMWKGKLSAFKNIDILPDINTDNLIFNDYEIFNLKFEQEESSYLNAIEIDKSPEGYLQLVLLNNKINEICNSGDEYEFIDKRTVIEIDGAVVEAPNFYYDERGNATVEYFKKYNIYNGAYKRVINTFTKDTSNFKIVDQFVALYMD